VATAWGKPLTILRAGVVGASALAPQLAMAQPEAGPSTAAVPANIERAERVAPRDVGALFAGKSWIWKDGAAYFQAGPRRFMATVGGDKVSTGEGRWTVSKTGVLCLVGRWGTKGHSAPARTCFDHRQVGKALYQRKLPDGAWYVLRSDPPAAGDEINKIREGNAVAGTRG